jgi:putative glutamine amidotransferase
MKIFITQGTFEHNLFCIFESLGHNPKIIAQNTKGYNLDDFDAFVLTGGGDINPSLYYEKDKTCYGVDNGRDLFERSIIYYALKTSKKLFGINRGHQLINVTLGGSLYQSLLEIDSCLHENKHFIKEVNPGIVPTIFKNLVNSNHHQAVKDVGILLTVTSIHKGCIESTENDQIITVQFHPELMYGKNGVDFFNRLSVWMAKKPINLYKGYI